MKLFGNHLLILAIFLIGCDPQPISNQKAIKEEIDNREIRRITKVEILEEASKLGELITKDLNEVLSEEVILSTLLDSLSKQYQVEINLITLADSSSSEESDILEAYSYAAENNLALESNVEDLENGIIVYSAPILGNSVSLPDNLYGLWNLRFSKKGIIQGME